MIRPVDVICLLVFVSSGMFAYQAKDQTKKLESTIEETLRATAKARSRVRDLQTAYSELNDPSRLQVLAEQHLPRLKPATPGQYTSLADLGRRLPAPGAFPVAEPPAPEPPTSLPPPLAPAVMTPSIAPPAPAAMAAAKPAATVQALAAAKPAPAPAAPTAPPRPTPLAATHVATAIAGPRPAPTPHAAPVFVPLAQSFTPPHPQALAPLQAQGQTPRSIPVEDLRRIANGAPVDATQPAVASALGMARSMLTAPTPVAPAYAARPPGRP